MLKYLIGRMFVVYVLRSDDGKFYKGVTNDLGRRLLEHRAGKIKTTSKMGNFEVAYTEQYEYFAEARKRELYFKSAAGRRFLKKVLGG